MATGRRPHGISRAAGRLTPAALAAVVAFAFASLTHAGRDDASAPRPLVLFDGKTLDGWKRTGFSGEGEVLVADGSIALKAGRSMTGVTCTRKDLPTQDYELTYEAMRVDGDDFFAAATFPVADSHLCLVNGGWGGGVTGLSSIDGVDASENETNRSIRYKNGQWYRFSVRVTARAVRCSVDGKEVIAVGTEGRRLALRVETKPSRPLGFATWKTSGAVRKVAVRPLTAAEVTAANKIDD